MRILIVEDNRRLAKSLQQGLKPLYAVDSVNSGHEGVLKAERIDYDAILLDLNLPDLSGEDVCRELRRRDRTMPIIILSGRDLVKDKISLLDMGADDYMTKPFNLQEVSARLRAVMRRTDHSTSTELVVGNLTLDPAARTLKRDKTLISLRRKEFDLFEYMMRHAGQTLTRAMILEHVWDMNEDLWANVVDVHIKHLRDKIDRPFGTNIIQTVHGVGYKLDMQEGA